MKEPNVKSVCGRVVEIRPQSRPAQLWALPPSDVPAGKALGSAQTSVRWSLPAFFKWSDKAGSGLRCLIVCCQSPPPLKGLNSSWDPADHLWFCSLAVLGGQLTRVPAISPSCSTLPTRIIARLRALPDVRDSTLLSPRRVELREWTRGRKVA